MRAKAKKYIGKVSMLSKFQTTMMQVMLQKIDRKSKPIRKQTKLTAESLHKKKIFLEQEGFDILGLLREKQSAAPAGREVPTPKDQRKQTRADQRKNEK